MKNPILSAHRRAFTLIELLVVIAIIAILAAILFPVFAQAKEAAKKTQSLSNVKQMALAVTMYAGDNDGGYPTWNECVIPGNPDCVFATSTAANYWDAKIASYVKNGRPEMQQYGGLWRCPGAKNQDQTKRSYSINFPLIYDVRTPGPYRFINESFVSMPADTVFVTTGGPDGRARSPHDGNHFNEWKAGVETTSAPYRFGGDTGVYGFLDGHSKALKQQLIYPAPTSKTATWSAATDGARARCASAKYFIPDEGTREWMRALNNNNAFRCMQ
jgi:prepilin-type N-terminal cleavage/methylation domain-containing protein